MTWTAADDAELDVMVDELTRSHAEHRKVCEACRHKRCREHGYKVCRTCAVGCPEVLAYLDHREDCFKCSNSIKADPCPRNTAHIAHGETCKRCNPCPHLQNAVAVVIEWQHRRELLSRAEELRRHQVLFQARREANEAA